MQSYKRTKILATIGPSTESKETLLQMVNHGMDAARFNFSHGTHTDHKRRWEILKEIEKETGKPITIVQDLQGPKIRLGDCAQESSYVEKGQHITLTHADKQTSDALPVKLDIFPYLKEGDHVLINDGLIKLRVERMHGETAACTVLSGGEIRSHKGINLPDTRIPNVSLTEKDIIDLEFGLKLGVDYVAVSFVQDAEDIQRVKDIIKEQGKEAKVISKIETKPAIDHLEAIIQASDVVMIARGDLAVEVGQEEVPLIQRQITKLCREMNRPVIVATQMLESMIHNAEPTRAEVNDVATAVLEQVDCVMLSAETAHGNYPVECVLMMERIIHRVERYFAMIHSDHTSFILADHQTQTAAIASAAAMLAHELDASLLLAFTASGATALELSRMRPIIPMFVITDNMTVSKQLGLVWGIKTYYLSKIRDNAKAFDEIVLLLKKQQYIKPEEKIVLVEGTHAGTAGHTNSIKVATST